jgi:hypothetical protein
MSKNVFDFKFLNAKKILKKEIGLKGIGGLSGPQPPCWRNQYQTPRVDKISNAAGLG